MEREEERQLKRRKNIVQILIITVGFVIIALFLAAFHSASPIQVYSVMNSGTVSEAEPEKAAEKEESDDDDWEDSSDWLAEASAGTVSETSSQAEAGEQEILMEKSIDINRASQDELDKLPGIGSVLAGRIIEYRKENGRFSTIEELKSVDGIGEKTFEKVRDYVIVK